MKVSSLRSSLLTIWVVLAAPAGASPILSCRNTGGGYLTQAITLESNEKTLTVKLERFSPVPDLVPNQGWK